MHAISVIFVALVLCATSVAAAPMIRRIQERISNSKSSLDATQNIDDLIKLDVSELCKIIQTKDTLITIFRMRKPLIAKEFHSADDAPNMCFGVHVAMRNNWIDIVEKYYTQNRCKDMLADRTDMAIWGSHLAYFQHRMKGGGDETESRYREFFDHAAKNGELHLLQTDLKHVDGSSDAIDWAALKGNIAMVKWLHDEKKIRNGGNEKTGCSRSAMAYAAAHNHAEAVQFLFEHCHDESNIKKAIWYARCMNREGILSYLMERTSKVESISTEGKDKIAIDV
jgi:hypothetical protein